MVLTKVNEVREKSRVYEIVLEEEEDNCKETFEFEFKNFN